MTAITTIEHLVAAINCNIDLEFQINSYLDIDETIKYTWKTGDKQSELFLTQAEAIYDLLITIRVFGFHTSDEDEECDDEF